jgi:transcriptional regulator with XRE-family HTH domain
MGRRRQPSAIRPSRALAEQLRKARKERGWSQEELVARLKKIGASGWRQSKVTKIERGEVKRITLDEAVELALALGVRPARLFASEMDVALTDTLSVAPMDFRAWLQGSLPPDGGEEAEWIYYTCLASDEVRAEIIELLLERREALKRGNEIKQELAEVMGMIDDEERLRDGE